MRHDEKVDLSPGLSYFCTMNSPNPLSSLTPFGFRIGRRRFLQAASASLALSALGADALDILNQKPKRVGLIGTRLVWEKRPLAVDPGRAGRGGFALRCRYKHAGRGRGARPASARNPKKAPDLQRLSRRCSRKRTSTLFSSGRRITGTRCQMIAAVEVGRRCLCAKADQRRCARRRSDARRRPQTQPRRAGRHAAQKHAAPRSRPRRTSSKPGLLGKVRPRGYLLLLSHAREWQSAGQSRVPDFLDYEMWTGPAPLRPYDGMPHVRWWRTFTEYGNGIVGDMCVHMLDTVRWMLGLGWPSRVSSTGGIFVDKDGKSNISDTQTATFEYDDLTIIWQHRTWGDAPDPKYPWAMTLFGDKGTLKASVMSYDFIPAEEGRVNPPRLRLRARAVSRRCHRERHRTPRRAGHSAAYAGFSGGHRKAWPSHCRHRARPHFDRELHSRQSLYAARRPAFGLRSQIAPSGRRFGSDGIIAPLLSTTLDPSRSQLDLIRCSKIPLD